MKLAAAALVIAAAAPAIAVAAPDGPCAFVTGKDVRHVLHWNVHAKRDSEYHLPQTSGELCTYDTAEGTVLVTLPDHGSSFFENNDLVDPFKNGLGTRVPGLGAAVELFDNVAYVNKHGRSISIAVLPNSGSADESSLVAFAKVVARRLP